MSQSDFPAFFFAAALSSFLRVVVVVVVLVVGVVVVVVCVARVPLLLFSSEQALMAVRLFRCHFPCLCLTVFHSLSGSTLN